MRLKKACIVTAGLLGIALTLHAQTDNIPFNDKQEQLLKRLDIKLPNDPVLRFSTLRQFDRKRVTEALLRIDSLDKAGALADRLSDVDRYEIEQLLLVNAQWVPEKRDSIAQNRGLVSPFFKTDAHLLESYTPGMDFIVDPMFTFQMGKATDSKRIFQTAEGLRIHGRIGKAFGFYGSYTHNLERAPLYVQQYIGARQAIPGVAAFKKSSGEGVYSFDDWRGGLTTHIGKRMDFLLAYDQLFIGEGLRSLYLSNSGSPFLFLKFHIQAGDFDFSSGVARTYAPYGITDNKLNDQGRPSNYMFFHYISWQATRWLKLGFYENNMFNNEKNGGFQLAMANPFIFSRAMSWNVGNSGKSSIGVDLKANVAHSVQLYGTLLINEFVAKEVFNYGKGSWVNKHAIQLGAKYTDAFTLKNLDLQGEFNWVRPYTYTDKWNVNNFVHYNQPLADPLGANFRELIGIANYHPVKKLFLTAKIIGYKKGLDTTDQFAISKSPTNGGDLFRPYTDSHAGSGLVKVGDGIPLNTMLASFTAAYELLPNLYIDGSVSVRHGDVGDMPKDHQKFFSFGIRWNMARRSFDF